MADMNEDRMQAIYREWGNFFSKRCIMNGANYYFTKSLEIKENDSSSLHNRSRAFLHMAKAKEALIDSTLALELKPRDCPINLQYSDSLFYLNDFGECIKSLHNNSKNFRGQKAKLFHNKIDVMEMTYLQCLGKTLLPFAMSNRQTFLKVKEMQMDEEILKDASVNFRKFLEECDVESIKQSKEINIHPREMERRKLAYKRLLQNYYGKSWVDLVFLSKLQFEKNLLLKQTPASTEQLRGQIEDELESTQKFTKMLHNRNPLYNLRVKNCPNSEIREKIKEDHLHRVQNITRKQMYTMLAKVKELRKKKQLMNLRKYIEMIMRYFVIIKTQRVMPWKYEFVNEIYSVYALALIDQIAVPKNILDYALELRPEKLFNVEQAKEKENKIYIFGDRSTYVPPDATDYQYIAYQKRINELQRLLQFTKYPIDKIFIYYAISQYHLENNRLKDCIQMATNGRTIANEAENDIWYLLCTIQIIRSQILQKQFDRLVETYKQAMKPLKYFKTANELKRVLNMGQIYNQALLKAQQKKVNALRKIKTENVTYEVI